MSSLEIVGVMYGFFNSPSVYLCLRLSIINWYLKLFFESQIPAGSTESLGIQVLKSREFFTEAYWYWIGIGATAGFILLFNVCFVVALTVLDGKCHYLHNAIPLESWSLY
jgi:hypothetical protein